MISRSNPLTLTSPLGSHFIFYQIISVLGDLDFSGMGIGLQSGSHVYSFSYDGVIHPFCGTEIAHHT